MASIADLARHWTRQTDKGTGIRIEAEAMDVLNAIGVGELIMMKAAETQRDACNQRIKSSTRAANTDSPMTESEMEASEPRISRLSGTMPPRDVTAAARRAQRASNRPRRN